MKICEVCGSNHLVEMHHVMFRSQAPVLRDCKLNLINLCYEHHRGTYGPHGSKGHKLDQELKKRLQDNLQLMFGKDIYYTREQIKDKLDISFKDVDKLLKTLLPIEGKYIGIDVIRAAMGGKLILGGN